MEQLCLSRRDLEPMIRRLSAGLRIPADILVRDYLTRQQAA